MHLWVKESDCIVNYFDGGFAEAFEGFWSVQLPACLFFAPASRILHSFANVWVFDVCIQ